MLNEKVAIITGGTRGIGFETVKLFAKNNARVILFGSKRETVEAAVEKLKKEDLDVSGFCPNLNNYEEVKDVIEQIYDKYADKVTWQKSKPNR